MIDMRRLFCVFYRLREQNESKYHHRCTHRPHRRLARSDGGNGLQHDNKKQFVGQRRRRQLGGAL